MRNNRTLAFFGTSVPEKRLKIKIVCRLIHLHTYLLIDATYKCYVISLGLAAQPHESKSDFLPTGGLLPSAEQHAQTAQSQKY